MRSVRIPRGRPNKVTKPSSAPARRPPRGRGASPVKPEHSYDDVDDSGMADDIHAAAAAVAAAAEMGDEVDGEMEEDDADPNSVAAAAAAAAAAAQSSLPHTENVDLNTAANILANGGAGSGGLSPDHDQQQQHHQHQHQQQHHHHHHHQHLTHQPTAPMGATPHQLDNHHVHHPHHSHLDPSFVKSTDEMARESGYGSLNIDSGLAKRLSREPGLRLAHQRRPEQQLNLARRSNVEALFAHIAGELAPTPCKNCHKGHGPWNSCVVVDGQMCGSCANCWFNASGARCSFHETRNPQAMHHSSSLLGAAASAPPPDHSAFAIHNPLPLPPGPPHGTLAALNLAAPMSNDPVLRYTIERAMNDVRAADRKTRQIMMVEIAAKQLALQILEYEESVADEQQQQQHQPSSQQQSAGSAQTPQGLSGEAGP